MLVPEEHPDAILLSGRMTDGAGSPVKEGMIEIWQADANGRYPELGNSVDGPFTGYGACHAEEDGSYGFIIVKPGSVPEPGGGNQAPHVTVAVNGLGILKTLWTRIYFSDEEPANSEDPVLQTVDEDRRHLLVALIESNRATFDIRLQGEGETPFFAV